MGIKLLRPHDFREEEKYRFVSDVARAMRKAGIVSGLALGAVFQSGDCLARGALAGSMFGGLSRVLCEDSPLISLQDKVTAATVIVLAGAATDLMMQIVQDSL